MLMMMRRIGAVSLLLGQASCFLGSRNSRSRTTEMREKIFYNDFEDYHDAPTSTLFVKDETDWRSFRKDLIASNAPENTRAKESSWAHETTTPEIGGLLIRMPLEVELYESRHHRNKLFEKLRSSITSDNKNNLRSWCTQAHGFINEQLTDIASEQGMVDPAELPIHQAELLSLYIDHQETWQEVCLVISDTASLVINRPMAFQLTNALAKLVLYGSSSDETALVKDFCKHFKECGVYVGGPQSQEAPGMILHGFAEIPGATELSSGVYLGGDVRYILDGVKNGVYKSLDFRFFIGKHDASRHLVNLKVGKLASIACSRNLILKQCIQLPKPLFHEILELCGGRLSEISEFEHSKSKESRIEVMEEDLEATDMEIVLLDEDDEFDEDDDDDYYII